MNRLSTQVFLVSIGVALLASIMTGLLVRDRILSAVEDAAENDLERDSRILAELSIYSFDTADGGFGGIDNLVDDLADQYDRRIAVTTLNRTVLGDSDPGAELPTEPAAVLESNSFTEFDETVFNECMNDFGLSSTITADGLIVGDVDELETREEEVGECFLEAEKSPDSDAFLFLGYPEDSAVNLGSLNLGTLMLGALAVMGIAGLGAVVLARRLSRPVVALTAAASQLEAGDLSQRVERAAAGEVGELGIAFNSMAARMEQTEAARTRMVSDIAHELRNPIGVLQGNLEAAQDGVFPTDTALIDTLHAETKHLANLVGDLQQLALSDVAGLIVRPALTDLAQLASEAVAAQDQANPTVTVIMDLEPAPVNVDATRMHQVISNLLANALVHTPDGGSVAVSVRQSDDSAVLVVADTGVGISADDLPHIFERFWRADASRNRATGGSGLGLSICKTIVDAHGGTISAQSVVGEGSTFTVTLPSDLPTGALFDQRD